MRWSDERYLPTHVSQDYQRPDADADRSVYAARAVRPVDDFGVPALEGRQLAEHCFLHEDSGSCGPAGWWSRKRHCRNVKAADAGHSDRRARRPIGWNLSLRVCGRVVGVYDSLYNRSAERGPLGGDGDFRVYPGGIANAPFLYSGGWHCPRYHDDSNRFTEY